MDRKDRRVNKRVPAEFEVNYVHDGDYLISHSKDLSVDGMFIYTENPPPVGDISKLTFSVGNLRSVTVLAKVVWANIEKSDIDSGMGVQFIDPPEELREAIIKIVNKVALLGNERDFPAWKC